MPWRKLLYAVWKKFQQLTNPEGVIASNFAFILEDTANIKKNALKIVMGIKEEKNVQKRKLITD